MEDRIQVIKGFREARYEKIKQVYTKAMLEEEKLHIGPIALSQD